RGTPRRCSVGTETRRRSSAGTSSSGASRLSSAPTAIARRARRTSTRPTRSRSGASARSEHWGCSTVPRSASSLRRHGLHLAQRRQAPEGLELDLPYPLARETEAAADLLERLRLRVVEAVP